MNKAADILAQRTHIAEYYDQAFQEFRGLRTIKIPDGATSSYYKYLAYLDPAYDRSEVKRIMREKYEVSLPGEVYADLCHNEPIWDNHNYCGRRKEPSVGCEKWPGCDCDTRQDGFPGAEYISKHHFCLPMYPGIDDETLAYVVESLERTMHQDLKV
jgi:dTDP-4-amino-4,6-dideoxygalactose transaminase